MYTITNIVEKLNFFDINCDINDVEKLIQELNINPIDDKSEEKLYDENAYEQIKNNLTFKQYDFAAKTAEITEEPKSYLPAEKAKNIEILAKTLSDKVTEDLKEYVKNNLYTEEAVKSGVYKHDNEILSKRLQEIITENKKLTARLNELEREHRKYHLLFSNIYIKEK